MTVDAERILSAESLNRSRGTGRWAVRDFPPMARLVKSTLTTMWQLSLLILTANFHLCVEGNLLDGNCSACTDWSHWTKRECHSSIERFCARRFASIVLPRGDFWVPLTSNKRNFKGNYFTKSFFDLSINKFRKKIYRGILIFFGTERRDATQDARRIMVGFS